MQGYRINRDHILYATVTTTAYTDNAVTAGSTHIYAVRAYNNAGTGQSSGNLSVTSPSGALRFPGDPGLNRIWLGANSGHMTTAEFDLAIFPGATAGSPPTKRFKLVREYSGGMIIEQRPAIAGWVSAGRIPMIESKSLPYTNLDILAGLADGDIINNANFMAGLNGPIWYTYFHEPESNFLTDTAQSDYRKAFRYIVNKIRVLAPNVAFVSPWFTWGNWPEPLNGAKDWRRWHPNWTGSTLATGTWANGGPFTVPALAGGTLGSYVNMDGIDHYNPKVAATLADTVRNVPWSTHIAEWYNHKTLTSYPYDLPYTIGEFGLYTYKATLDDSGVTVTQIMTDMVEKGAALEGLVGVTFWANSYARWTDGVTPTGGTYDPLREKRNGLRDVINSHTRVRML